MPNILLVDDRPENLIALEALLEDCRAELFKANSGSEALAQLLERDFALVLLDVQMPEMDGFEVAELMRMNHDTRHIPIIFVTAISKEQHHIFRGYESGAVDYLSKPIEPMILRSKVNIFLELWTKQNELEMVVAQLESANRKVLSQQEELRQLAIRDHLTGLYQRRWFDEMLTKEVALATRKKTPLSLALLDIDFFKHVNDIYGHNGGDSVLVQLADVMQKSLRASDILFRYGGEEFAVLMPHTGLSSAVALCERIRMTVEKMIFTHGETDISVTISIGVAQLLRMVPPSPQVLIENADSLLYLAKSRGRNQVCYNKDCQDQSE